MNTSIRDEAAKAFFERHHGRWTAEAEAILETRLAAEPVFAQAYRRMERSWRALGRHAESSEIVALREQALADVRHTSIRRWGLPRRTSRQQLAAGLLGVAFIFALIWQLSPLGFRPGQYQTRVGEQRMLELEDHSRIAIDSATKLRVRYSDDVRIVQLLEGQAQFSVARDPARPFKVHAGNRTIIALGTTFTVEYVNHEIRVAMLDGSVAVISESDADNSRERSPDVIARKAGRGLELSAGEALRVDRDGRATVSPIADIEAATAWREGKVILRTETLDEAVRKMNRYSTVKLKIADPSLANEHISGVFEAGNSQGFVEDLQEILAIDAKYADSKTIELRRP
jgi:transmembrane sensor